MRPLRQSDAWLARRATAGDKAAFAAIFERYGQDLYRYCRAILGDPTDAQDALQNTMTRILRALPGEPRTITLRPWLYRVARNESLTFIRQRELSVELTDESSPAVPAADISAERRETVRTLVADIASLPEIQRSALVLHEMSGLSHEEVSEALQRSPRSSRQAIYDARLALQDLEEGRAMDCDEIRALISDGDRRVIRGRKIKAHLRDCQRCADFALGIRQRRTLLGWLAPPLPAAAASGLVGSALGGAGGAGGALGTGAGAAGALGGSAVLKSVGIVGAGLAIGVGGAGVAGVDLPGGSGERASRGDGQAESASGLEPAASPMPASIAAKLTAETGIAAVGSPAKVVPPGAHGKKDRAKNGTSSKENPQGGKPSQPPGQSGDKAPGPPAHSNGNSSGPPAHSNAGGNSGGPPAHSSAGGSSAGVQPVISNGGGSSDPPAHSNAGGASSAPPEHPNEGGQSDKEK